MRRKPSLLVHIRDESSGPAVAGEEADQGLSTGEVNEALMKMLLEQGRLNLDQVIAAAAQNLEQPVDEARELLQRHFLGLVQVCDAALLCCTMCHCHTLRLIAHFLFECDLWRSKFSCGMALICLRYVTQRLQLNQLQPGLLQLVPSADTSSSAKFSVSKSCYCCCDLLDSIL